MSDTMRATATCRQCGRPIAFRQLESGRYQPIDPDTGDVHFATCPARRPPPSVPDDTCHRCGSADTERRPGTAMHFAGLSCRACGGFRWLRRPQG